MTWRLRSLQSQLSPHFLFNALNSLSGMARSADNPKLVRALARLGDMLRFALETSERSLITLTEELDFTRHYVALQHLRFGERYRFQLDVDMFDESPECPPFVLQSLVENAFTHAVDGSSEPVRIDARVTIAGPALEFRVVNSPGQKRLNGNGLGIALKNLDERLRLIYGERCEVSADATTDRYTAIVRIPARPND